MMDNPKLHVSQAGEKAGFESTQAGINWVKWFNAEGRYPFKLWTLERLQNPFQERQGVHLSDSTIWEWIEAKGFRWKR